MKIKDLDLFLKEYLEVDRFNDHCPNGMQVEASEEVTRVALGVSASLSLFRKAKAFGAEVLIVHHGLFWDRMPGSLKGVHGQRVGYLFRNGLSLFGFHLPLDRHPEIGNNACLARSLGLQELKSFAVHGGVEIGWIGNFPKAVSLDKAIMVLKKTVGQINQVYDFGKKRIKKVGVVSGGASSDVIEAESRGADLFITGEAAEPTQEWCREARMNYIAAGHYATETLGVQKLGKIISDKFKIDCRFIPVPNRI